MSEIMVILFGERGYLVDPPHSEVVVGGFGKIGGVEVVNVHRIEFNVPAKFVEDIRVAEHPAINPEPLHISPFGFNSRRRLMSVPQMCDAIRAYIEETGDSNRTPEEVCKELIKTSLIQPPEIPEIYRRGF